MLRRPLGGILLDRGWLNRIYYDLLCALFLGMLLYVFLELLSIVLNPFNNFPHNDIRRNPTSFGQVLRSGLQELFSVKIMVGNYMDNAIHEN